MFVGLELLLSLSLQVDVPQILSLEQLQVLLVKAGVKRERDFDPDVP